MIPNVIASVKDVFGKFDNSDNIEDLIYSSHLDENGKVAIDMPQY
jgi:hypothetical protein